MELLDCGHTAPLAKRRICSHLLPLPAPDYSVRFTGEGSHYDLICRDCFKAPETIEAPLRRVCADCLHRIEEEGYWCDNQILGAPQIRERASRLHFTRHEIPCALSRVEPLADLQPLTAASDCVLLGVTASGRLIRWNLTTGLTEDLGALPSSRLDMSLEVSLHLSADGKFAAIVNTMGQYGIVVNLETLAVTMSLDRGDYHPDVSVFPVAFFTHEGRTLLVYGTEWKRLDISDPSCGVCLTQRILPSYEKGVSKEHELNYFHGGLSVSPDQRWIVDNGWVWHPVGVVCAWRLDRWVEENSWESEDGPSRKELCYRSYFWDGPVCWIDNQTVAVWGWGEDDDDMLPAARLFDVATGDELRWFAGPVGQSKYSHAPWNINWNINRRPSLLRPQDMFVFDKYLFSFTEQDGTSVFDVETGERLLHDATFCPLRYHRETKQFVTLSAEGDFCLYRLEES